MVEQLVDAARGGDPDEEWYLTGRQFILAALTGWIADGQPGVKVVTGPPGSGKSAVLGQLLCLSDPERRAELLRHGPIESADPGRAPSTRTWRRAGSRSSRRSGRSTSSCPTGASSGGSGGACGGGANCWTRSRNPRSGR